jgi:rhodanese-related sulfurtransferase
VVIITSAAIYLTPLKWVTVLQPVVQDIAPTDFYAQYKLNPEEYLFIDVRPQNPYNAIHAMDSVNMPIQTLYDLHPSLPKKGKKIVLICSGGQASGVAYSYLQHYGFFNIVRIGGGIEKWIQDGLPVEGASANPLQNN